MNGMKLGSLFDGSGGFPLAGRLCGIEPVWASEIEEYPIRVTTKNFPNMKHLGDVTNVNGAEIEPVDVITFGSPCQDLSCAGKQKGIVNGERSSLFFEAIRIITEMREATDGRYPRFAVWENVPGAFTSNNGFDFLEVLRAFAGIYGDAIPEPDGKNGKLAWRKAGGVLGDQWSLAWRVLDAQYWGVPQRRKRIFLVCDLGGGRAGEVLFKRESRIGDPSKGIGAWETAFGCTRKGTRGHSEAWEIIPLDFNPTDSRIRPAEDGVMPTITQRLGTGGNQGPVVMTKDAIRGSSQKFDTSPIRNQINPHHSDAEARVSEEEAKC